MQIKENAFLITGGASGLGFACAQRIIELGGKCVLVDLNDEAGIQSQKKLGENSLFVSTDVTSEESVNEMLDRAFDWSAEVRGAIQCAGVAFASKTVSKKGPHSLDLFAKTININLVGTFNVMRLLADRLKDMEPTGDDPERGVFVNTASVAAFDGQIGQIAYAASKGGVASMTLPAARDLATYGIRVMTIAPGTFLTPMLAKLPQKVREILELQTPFPSRLGKPSEYAALACHIIENPMLNGEVIRIDGALRMPPK